MSSGLQPVSFDQVVSDEIAEHDRVKRFNAFAASQQAAYERKQRVEIAPPVRDRGLKVTPEEYADISYAYYQGLISEDHRSHLITNPHPEGLSVVREAVQKHRIAEAAAREAAADAERKRIPNALLLAVEWGMITPERMGELLKAHRVDPRASAFEINAIVSAVEARIRALDIDDAEHAAAGVADLPEVEAHYQEMNVHEHARQNFAVELVTQDIADRDKQKAMFDTVQERISALNDEAREMQTYRSIFDGQEHRSAKGGRQSKTAGAYYQLPGEALRLFWDGVSGTPFLLGDFAYHLHASRLHLCALLEDTAHGPVRAHDLQWAIIHLAIAIERKTYPDKRDFRAPGAFGLVRVAQVMEIGARKYGRGNWRNIEYWSEIDHAVQHLIAYDFGDESAYKAAYEEEYGPVPDRVECNLWNALTRLCMAAEVFDAEYRFTSDKD